MTEDQTKECEIRLFSSSPSKGMPRQQLAELRLADGDLFGAALLTPAFGSDLSTWTVTINKHGLLTQTVLIVQPPSFDEGIAVLRQHVPSERLATLKTIVQDENLTNFGQFPQLCVTDLERTRLMFQVSGKTTVIDAYGPHAMATLGETDTDKDKAQRYCRLWDAILGLTPFMPYRD